MISRRSLFTLAAIPALAAVGGRQARASNAEGDLFATIGAVLSDVLNRHLFEQATPERLAMMESEARAALAHFEALYDYVVVADERGFDAAVLTLERAERGSWVYIPVRFS